MITSIGIPRWLAGWKPMTRYQLSWRQKISNESPEAEFLFREPFPVGMTAQNEKSEEESNLSHVTASHLHLEYIKHVVVEHVPSWNIIETRMLTLIPQCRGKLNNCSAKMIVLSILWEFEQRHLVKLRSATSHGYVHCIARNYYLALVLDILSVNILSIVQSKICCLSIFSFSKHKIYVLRSLPQNIYFVQNKLLVCFSAN